MVLDPLLYQLTQIINQSWDLEGLTRTLLPLLADSTGLDSTYLARLDPELQLRWVEYAYNRGSLSVAEQQSDPYIQSQVSMHASVPGPLGFPGSHQARPVVIRRLQQAVHISAPIRVAGNIEYGVLCGIGAAGRPIEEATCQALSLFAFLIACQLDREHLLARLRRDGGASQRHALIDPLTGVANRRALLNELTRMLANTERSGSALHVACIDVDDFRRVNQRYGGEVGDQFLVHIARSLTGGMRQGDLVARTADDRFIVVAGAGSKDHGASRDALRARVAGLLAGHFGVDAAEFPFDGASVGIITSGAGDRSAEQVVTRAERAMFEVKRLRQSNRLTESEIGAGPPSAAINPFPNC